MAKATSKNTTSDPIIKLIDRAQACLGELREADRALQAIEEKIGEANTHAAPIGGGLAFQRVFGSQTFMTEWFLNQECRRVTANLKKTIKTETTSLRGGKLDQAQQLYARQNILEAKASLAAIPLIRAFGEREWRAESARLHKLWRETGYAKADIRHGAAVTAARDAVLAVAATKPSTAEGGLALIKFVADRANGENMVLRMLDGDAEICAPLYRAHDVLKAAEMARAA